MRDDVYYSAHGVARAQDPDQHLGGGIGFPRCARGPAFGWQARLSRAGRKCADRAGNVGGARTALRWRRGTIASGRPISGPIRSRPTNCARPPRVSAPPRRYSPARPLPIPRSGLSMISANTAILHFATHGLVTAPKPECPPRPALLTSFGDNEDSDGLLSFAEIFGLRIDADLVILSACDTAGSATIGATREAGVTSGGEFALDGLVRAFVGAGGRTVLASHWPVPDDFDATGRLIIGPVRRGQPRNRRGAARIPDRSDGRCRYFASLLLVRVCRGGRRRGPSRPLTARGTQIMEQAPGPASSSFACCGAAGAMCARRRGCKLAATSHRAASGGGSSPASAGCCPAARSRHR